MTTLHRYALLLFAAVLAAVLAGCATTEIVGSWKDPDIGRVPFRKVLVVFQHHDPAIRRVLEDQMAVDVQNAIPAYKVFSDAEVRDMDVVKQRVRAEGFDSAIILRIVRVDREVSYRPGRVYGVPGYYGRFYGYWGYGWGAVYDPGYLRSDRVVTIATNVYSVADDKLVWASQSETFNPASLRAAIGDVVRVTSQATGELLRARG